MHKPAVVFCSSDRSAAVRGRFPKLIEGFCSSRVKLRFKPKSKKFEAQNRETRAWFVSCAARELAVSISRVQLGSGEFRRVFRRATTVRPPWNCFTLKMVNKKIQKLLQNTRGRYRREESSNRGLNGENQSQDVTPPHSPSETQNAELELQHHVEHNEEGSSQRSQNTRGRTVMRDVHSLGPNDLLVVRFNERGQPYGEMQPTLSNFVGTIARNGNLLPLSFLDWRKIPKNRLDLAWGSVTARFCIPTRHRNIVMQIMGVAWRRWRTEVKATSYDPNIPLDELLQVRPVPHKLAPEVWEILCDYWKKNERTSKINRENAHKKRRIHAQGRINIPTLEDKFFQENGVKPTRIEILELSCQSKKKGGAPIDDEAIRHEALLNEAVKRHLQDMPEGTDPRQVHEQALREVFGPEHSGRVRCLGDGALPSQVFREQYNRSHCQGYDIASDATEKFKEMEEKIKEMEAREAEREAQRKAEIEAKEAEREARLHAEMEAQAQRQTEMEQSMRRMQEQQFLNFTRIMTSMMVGTTGGSRGPETLTEQMAGVMAEIMQKYMGIPSNAQESFRTPPP